MIIRKQSACIVNYTPHLEESLELAGRTAYRSEAASTPNFLARIIKSGHTSVLEHGSITVDIECDRGITHELVRHRLASYTQESTRYCNYGTEKFSNNISVIQPCFESDTATQIWSEACARAEVAYMQLLKEGVKPQLARAVLPTCLATKIVVTANPREWRHIFKMRCAADAHPQIRSLMLGLLSDFASRWPLVFGDLAAEFLKTDELELGSTTRANENGHIEL